MDFSLIIPSFIAGLLTFLAPCTLPMVPAYLGLLGGVTPRKLQDPETAAKAQKSIMASGVFFVLGFSLVFIALGTLAGIAGSAVAPYRVWTERLSGILVILFGIVMLGAVRIPFLVRERRVDASPFLKHGRKINASVLGAAFALGWTPCIGPVLGTILLLASNAGTAAQGTVLLAVFSLGLALPFLAVAFFVQRASSVIARMEFAMRAVSVAGGLLLIALGAMLLSGTVGYFISASFRLLRFINYDALLNYL